MDFQLNAEQEQLDTAFTVIMSRHAGLERARDLGARMDGELLRTLQDSEYLDMAHATGFVEAVLLVERAAESAACAPIAARVLVGPLMGLVEMPPALGLAHGRREAMVPYAAECDAFLALDDDRAVLASAEDVKIQTVDSGFGPGVGSVTVLRGRDLGAGSGDVLRRAWQIAIAAEIAGTLRAAIHQTTDHVLNRHQFGRPIGSFQAVQHHLARSHAMAEATRWLARRGAWFHDDEFLTASAAAYACEAAKTGYASCHQVTGAIGLTTEYGLVLWTMRLASLQRALGGRRAHAQRVAAARRSMDLAGLPSPL